MIAPSFQDYEDYVSRRRCEKPAAFEDPLVSIVTVSMNAARTISKTIDSVHRQSYRAIEHLFIDGGSTDGTIEIIRNAARPQDYILAERDKGISDAFNKGVAVAKGRWILFLNADDWLSPDQIAIAVALLEQSGADFVFGDLIFYEAEKPLFRYRGDPHYSRTIKRRMPTISHPTVLATRHCFEKAGLFDLRYRNAMDYDWFLRVYLAGLKGVYSSRILGHMTHDGVSNLHFARTIEEMRAITVAHGRSRGLAALEAGFRLMKTTLAQPLKGKARPFYHAVRRIINPSFQPLPLR